MESVQNNQTVLIKLKEVNNILFFTVDQRRRPIKKIAFNLVPAQKVEKEILQELIAVLECYCAKKKTEEEGFCLSQTKSKIIHRDVFERKGKQTKVLSWQSPERPPKQHFKQYQKVRAFWAKKNRFYNALLNKEFDDGSFEVIFDQDNFATKVGFGMVQPEFRRHFSLKVEMSKDSERIYSITDQTGLNYNIEFAIFESSIQKPTSAKLKRGKKRGRKPKNVAENIQLKAPKVTFDVEATGTRLSRVSHVPGTKINEDAETISDDSSISSSDDEDPDLDMLSYRPVEQQLPDIAPPPPPPPAEIELEAEEIKAREEEARSALEIMKLPELAKDVHVPAPSQVVKDANQFVGYAFIPVLINLSRNTEHRETESK